MIAWVGTLKLYVHNALGGDADAVVVVDGRTANRVTVDGDRWKEIVVPFDHSSVLINAVATGWWNEHVVMTYAIDAGSVVGVPPLVDSPKSGGAHAESPPHESEQPISQDEAISDQQVDQTRTKLINELTAELTAERKQVTRLERGSQARDEAANRIRALSNQLDSVKGATRDEIRQMILQAEQERREQQAAAQAAKEEREKKIATILRAKFPGWDGPWRSCLVCNGTGRDEIAERAENDRLAGAALERAAGTSGVHVAGKLAVIPCETCGGTGLVPDHSR